MPDIYCTHIATQQELAAFCPSHRDDNFPGNLNSSNQRRLHALVSNLSSFPNYTLGHKYKIILYCTVHFVSPKIKRGDRSESVLFSVSLLCTVWSKSYFTSYILVSLLAVLALRRQERLFLLILNIIHSQILPGHFGIPPEEHTSDRNSVLEAKRIRNRCRSIMSLSPSFSLYVAPSYVLLEAAW